MTKAKRISLSLPADLVDEFDAFFAGKGMHNRSQACELLFRDYLTHASLRQKGEIVGILMAVYDHRKPHLLTRLTKLQHDFHDIIVSSQHMHLDQEHCLEAIFLRGNGKSVQKLSDKLLATKGIRLGRSLFHMM